MAVKYRSILPLLVLLAVPPFIAQEAPKKSCIIVAIHRHRFGENMTRIAPHGFYDYIEGDYPAGMKSLIELNRKQFREVQDKGGHIVVLRTDYQLSDLKDAREQCSAFTARPGAQ